jgi:hypothetical protein
MFRQQELVHFVPAFVQATRRLLAGWRDNEVRPIERDMTQVTFDVISATLLPSADAGMPAAIERSTASFQRAGSWGQLYAWVHVPRWLPQPGRGRSAAAVATLRGAVLGILAERPAARRRTTCSRGSCARATPRPGSR